MGKKKKKKKAISGEPVQFRFMGEPLNVNLEKPEEQLFADLYKAGKAVSERGFKVKIRWKR